MEQYNEPSAPIELHFPTAAEVFSWPQTVRQKELEAKKSRLEDEIARLKAQLTTLVSRLETHEYDEPTRSDKLDPQTKQLIRQHEAKREKDSKDEILSHLQGLSIADGGAIEASYTIYHDHDLAGGFNENRQLLLAKSAGVILLAQQVTYSDSVGVQRDLRPHGVKYLFREDGAAQPLVIESNGMLRNIGSVSLGSSRPTRWDSISQRVSCELEAFRAQQILESTLDLLDTDNLYHPTLPNGEPATHELFTEQLIIPLAGNLTIKSGAKYWREGTWYARSDVRYETGLSYVYLQLCMGDEVKEQYVVDKETLEVRRGPYSSYDGSGNKHLHSKAEDLLATAKKALEKDGTK